MQVEPQRRELLGQEIGVRVDDLTEQQLGADRKNFCSHVTAIKNINGSLLRNCSPGRGASALGACITCAGSGSLSAWGMHNVRRVGGAAPPAPVHCSARPSLRAHFRGDPPRRAAALLSSISAVTLSPVTFSPPPSRCHPLSPVTFSPVTLLPHTLSARVASRVADRCLPQMVLCVRLRPNRAVRRRFSSSRGVAPEVNMEGPAHAVP